MKFKGDIIITDPCYIDNEDDYSNRKLWDSDTFDIFTGNGLKDYGFTNYIWEDTLYGDWSRTVFELRVGSVDKKVKDLDSKCFKSKTLGKFCADAGLVGVFLLNEVLKFNPKFDYHRNRPWTTAWLKDFDGDIEYIVYNDEAFIRGTGNINFVTRQTGF